MFIFKICPGKLFALDLQKVFKNSKHPSKVTPLVLTDSCLFFSCVLAIIA